MELFIKVDLSLGSLRLKRKNYIHFLSVLQKKLYILVPPGKHFRRIPLTVMHINATIMMNHSHTWHTLKVNLLNSTFSRKVRTEVMKHFKTHPCASLSFCFSVLMYYFCQKSEVCHSVNCYLMR